MWTIPVTGSTTYNGAADAVIESYIICWSRKGVTETQVVFELPVRESKFAAPIKPLSHSHTILFGVLSTPHRSARSNSQPMGAGGDERDDADEKGSGSLMGWLQGLLSVAALALLVWILIMVVQWMRRFVVASNHLQSPSQQQQTPTEHTCDQCGVTFRCRRVLAHEQGRPSPVGVRGIVQLERRAVTLHSVPLEVTETSNRTQCCAILLSHRTTFETRSHHHHHRDSEKLYRFCSYDCYSQLHKQRHTPLRSTSDKYPSPRQRSPSPPPSSVPAPRPTLPRRTRIPSHSRLLSHPHPSLSDETQMISSDSSIPSSNKRSSHPRRRSNHRETRERDENDMADV
jgi:hypothetical protein